jgi:transmembrane sensor
MKKNEFYKQLVSNYLNNRATSDELEALFHLLQEGKLDAALNESLTRELEGAMAAPQVIPLIYRNWFRIAAVAVLLITVTGIFFLFDTQEKPKQATQIQPAGIDLPPGGNKAVLTLADATQIVLDSAANGTLANQGKTTVVKLGNQILYKAAGKSGEVLYNTISTPRSGQYQLTLPDNSKVWLNAESMIRFPVAFAGNERKIEISGEVYLEVTKDDFKPFIVMAGDARITVMGTSFNIRAYKDENNLKATLVEGKIKISSKTEEKQIVPGQQVRVMSQGELFVQENVNIREILAWKNGLFIFNNATAEEILSQVARWYDVEIEYAGETGSETFYGVISRRSNVFKVLNIMQQAGLKFTVTKEKIKVENI